MAIYGRWEDCAAQAGPHPGFALAFRFIEGVVSGTNKEAVRTLEALPEGETHRIDLDGDAVYATLIHRPTRLRADSQLEAHRQYADVQFVLRGREVMEVAPLTGLTLTKPYDEKDDYELYSMTDEGTKLIMNDGMCAVLFPSDAHAPLQARDGKVQANRRLVVKVRDPLAR
jgi:biofilm protein TabA